MEYEFTFVVEGAGPEDDDAVSTLFNDLDAMLALAGGVIVLTIAAEGATALDAASQAVRAACSAVPQLKVLRIDRDLVGVPEISQRTGRTRQNVLQWINGERQAKRPFPAPEGTAGRARVWLWTEVNDWLRDLDLDDGSVYPTRDEMTDIDHALLRGWRVAINVDVGANDAYMPQRKAIVNELVRHQAHIGFIDYVAQRPSTRDPIGQHVVVVASAGELAFDAVRRIANFGHPVILASLTKDKFFASVVAPGASNTHHNPVVLHEKTTVRDWIGLMQLHPEGATFMVSGPESGSRLETAPILELA